MWVLLICRFGLILFLTDTLSWLQERHEIFRPLEIQSP